jgi:hypothetical protein
MAGGPILVKTEEAPEMDGRLESLEFIKELFMALVSLT